MAYSVMGDTERVSDGTFHFPVINQLGIPQYSQFLCILVAIFPPVASWPMDQDKTLTAWKNLAAGDASFFCRWSERNLAMATIRVDMAGRIKIFSG